MDTDRDGVPDWKDCRPFDYWRQHEDWMDARKRKPTTYNSDWMDTRRYKRRPKTHKITGMDLTMKSARRYPPEELLLGMYSFSSMWSYMDYVANCYFESLRGVLLNGYQEAMHNKEFTLYNRDTLKIYDKDKKVTHFINFQDDEGNFGPETLLSITDDDIKAYGKDKIKRIIDSVI